MQIGSINNTGTGGITGPTYTNYSAQYSTPLSRNALTTLSVTSGANSGDRYAAWIDMTMTAPSRPTRNWARFTTTAVFQMQNIAFTVPTNGRTGSTVLRVRGANSPNPGLDPCFPYTFGETEDYARGDQSEHPAGLRGCEQWHGPARYRLQRWQREHRERYLERQLHLRRAGDRLCGCTGRNNLPAEALATMATPTPPVMSMTRIASALVCPWIVWVFQVEPPCKAQPAMMAMPLPATMCTTRAASAQVS